MELPKQIVDRINPRFVSFVLLFIASGCYVFNVSTGFFSNIFDFHGFRQSQTAISVDYLLKGGNWLAYETPVFGFPWAIPFEFPIFQWIVAAVASLTDIQLVVAGRLVSIFFHVASIVVALMIFRRLHFGRATLSTLGVLLFLSPLYTFWSRTFLIESTAVFLSLVYFLVGIEAKRPTHFIVEATLGVLAGIVKITTFWPFFFLVNLRKLARLRNSHDAYQFAPSLIAGVGTILWTKFADYHKSLNPLADGYITSPALNLWNFGSFEQRLSLTNWEVFLDRVSYILGNSIWLLLIALLLPTLHKKSRVVLVGCLVGFVVAPLTFFNLFYVHEYYFYSVAYFLLAGTAIAIGSALESTRFLVKVGGAVCLGVIAFSMLLKQSDYRILQSKNDPYVGEIGNAIEQATNLENVIVLIGVDWSSEIPFASNRRAIALMAQLNNWKAKTEAAIQNTMAAGHNIENVVVCDSPHSEELFNFVAQILPVNRVSSIRVKHCSIYSARTF